MNNLISPAAAARTPYVQSNSTCTPTRFKFVAFRLRRLDRFRKRLTFIHPPPRRVLHHSTLRPVNHATHSLIESTPSPARFFSRHNKHTDDKMASVVALSGGVAAMTVARCAGGGVSRQTVVAHVEVGNSGAKGFGASALLGKGTEGNGRGRVLVCACPHRLVFAEP